MTLVVVGMSAFLLPLTAAAATWNAPYQLGAGGAKPAVAVDDANVIHYVWWEPTAKVIQYKACAGLDKNSCTATETLPNNGGESYYPNIAIDPQGRPNAVWESREGGSYAVYWARRENGSWSAIKKISQEPYSELPDIAIGPQGIIHVVYQSKQDNTGYIYYVESSDGFATLTKNELAQHVSDAPIESAAEAGLNDLTPEGKQLSNGLFPRLTVDANDRAHIVWNAPSPYGIYYRIQNQDGTFAQAITVSTGHKDQTPDIVYSPTGATGILWGTYDNFNAAFAEYIDGRPDLKKYDVDGGLEQSLWPRVGVDCNGLFYFAFQGKVSADGNWDIFARSYNSADNKFGKRVTIGNTGSQEQTPAIALNNVGAIVFANTSSGNTMGATTNLGLACDGAATSTPTATMQASATPTNTDVPGATATYTPTPTNTVSASATPTNTDVPTATPTNTDVPPTIVPTATDTIANGTEHIPSDDPRIVYSGTWSQYKNKKASDDHYKRCGGKKACKKNWSAELSFIGGSQVQWETAYANTYGKVQVLIDGKLFEQIDLCRANRKSAAPKFGVRTYIVTGDANTPHTIKIQAMGKHSKCSDYAANFVVVDGFNIMR